MLAAGFAIASLIFGSAPARAQIAYRVHFKLEKQATLAGEPVFCDFVIRNAGPTPFIFSYRFPSRAENPNLESEPNFTITDARGKTLPDPQPHFCGGAKGNVVYGTASLAPGGVHTERWLLTEWASFTRPGIYHVRAERHLPLYALKPGAALFSGPPAAYALALDNLTLRIEPPNPQALLRIFEPYLKALRGPAGPHQSEAMLVISAAPHSFALGALAEFAESPAKRGPLRHEALQGLARIGGPDAWRAILRVAEGQGAAHEAGKKSSAGPQAFAILLLGESRDARFVPPLVEMLPHASAETRGEILQTLGDFGDPRAAKALIHYLHSPNALDRESAILGLKNTGRRDAIPPLLAMLNDPNPQVRAIANFALDKLTGHQGSSSSPQAMHWQAWWRSHDSSFEPQSPAPCRDW